jgi:hypothetical protein
VAVRDSRARPSLATVFPTDAPLSCLVLTSRVFAKSRYFEYSFRILGDNS